MKALLVFAFAALLQSVLPFSLYAGDRPPVSKDRGKAGAAVIKTTEGTFLGIEEGDYSHWKMRTPAGEELSYFILHPDASIDKVLGKPKPFIGRKCRVQWKSSTENIPEAGGKTTIEQVLSVEWLGKK